MRSLAEILIDVAEEVKLPKDELLFYNTGLLNMTVVDWFKLALDFDKLPPAIKLKAMMEEWDQVRIVREVY